MTWNRGSVVKPHFHASHLRVFISYTRASLSHYSLKSLLHRPLYLISVVHDAPPSRQFWYRIMVSRLNDASKASSSLLFSWGGSGEVTPAKSLMRAKSSSTAYDTGKPKHLSSNSHSLMTLRQHKFAAHSSFPALPANQKGGLLILSTANVWWEIIPTMPYCAKTGKLGKTCGGKTRGLAWYIPVDTDSCVWWDFQKPTSCWNAQPVGEWKSGNAHNTTEVAHNMPEVHFC